VLNCDIAALFPAMSPFISGRGDGKREEKSEKSGNVCGTSKYMSFKGEENQKLVTAVTDRIALADIETKN
jgi:hypothetical protein